MGCGVGDLSNWPLRNTSPCAAAVRSWSNVKTSSVAGLPESSALSVGGSELGPMSPWKGQPTSSASTTSCVGFVMFDQCTSQSAWLTVAQAPEVVP